MPKISGDTDFAVSAGHKQPDKPAWAQGLLWDYSSKTVFVSFRAKFFVVKAAPEPKVIDFIKQKVISFTQFLWHSWSLNQSHLFSFRELFYP